MYSNQYHTLALFQVLFIRKKNNNLNYSDLYPAYFFTILSAVLILAPFNLVLPIDDCALIQNTNKEQNTQTPLFSCFLSLSLFFFFFFLPQPILPLFLSTPFLSRLLFTLTSFMRQS